MTKAEIRQRIWKTIEREAVGRFPFGSGRIPNFAGAEQAAQLLREMAVWRRALVVKVNPDAPQLAVRRLALAGGQDRLHGRPAPAHGEVLHRDRSAALREARRARRQHRGRVPVRPRRVAARDAAGRPDRLRLGRRRTRRRARRQGRRLLRPRVRAAARGGQGPRVDAHPHHRAPAADHRRTHPDAAARPAGRLPGHAARGRSRRVPRIRGRAASTGTCCARSRSTPSRCCASASSAASTGAPSPRRL